jgi:hypothetical protein
MYRPKKGTTYTPKIVAFMKQHCKKVTCIADLVSLVNKHFNTAFTYKQVRACMYIYGLCTHKRGNHSDKPIGTVIKDTRGHLKIKISNKKVIRGKTPHTWKRYNIYLWEKKYGKIPKNHKVIYLDKNKDNCAILLVYLIKFLAI